MIEINGIDGGGQVLRSALSLAMVTGDGFRMVNIRGRRSKPGLKRQHLTCVGAAVAICGGSVDGAEMNSMEIVFRPGEVVAGEYDFAVGSAGSTTLVFQTLLPALMLAGGESVVSVSGGTHHPMAPSADYVSEAFLPMARKFGVDADLVCDRVGFAPAGGGRIVATVRPSALKGCELLERGEMVRKELKGMCLNLSGEIMLREVKAAQKQLVWDDAEVVLDQVVDGDGAGNCFAIQVDSEFVRDRFTEYGAFGVSAERVAGNVGREVKRYLASPGAVGEKLADQLLLPMALAGGGAFTVRRISNHLRTNMAVVRKFLEVGFEVRELDGCWWVGVK